MERLGLKTFRLYLEVSCVNLKKQQELFDKYAAKPNTQWVAMGEGEWDYILRFSLRNEEEFKEEVEKFMAEYGRFVKRKSIALSMYHAYCPMTHFLGTQRRPRVAFEKLKPVKLKRADYEILNTLYENARTPTTELAFRLRLTPEAVQYRLKKLIREKCIDYFTAWYDSERLGFEYYKVFLWLQYATQEKEKALIRYCENHPNIVFLVRVIGDWDLEVDIHAKNPSEPHQIVGDLIAKHSAIIRDHATIVVLKNVVPNPLKQFLF